MAPDHEGTDVAIPDLNAPDDAGDPTDPGGWGARFVGSLNLQIGKLTASQDATTDQLRKMRQEARNLPALVKISSAFTWSSAAGAQMCQQGLTGAGVLIGGPNVGEQWIVRQIVVGAPTLAAAWLGQVYFLTSAAPPNEQSITSVSAAISPPTAGPAVQFFGDSQLYVGPNENLYMVVVGGTNNAVYVASISYQSSPFVPRATEVSM